MDNFNELLTNLIALGAIALHIAIFSGIVFYFTGYKKQVISIVGKWGVPAASFCDAWKPVLFRNSKT